MAALLTTGAAKIVSTRKGTSPAPRKDAVRRSDSQGGAYRRTPLIPVQSVQDAQSGEKEGADTLLLRTRAANAAYIVFWSTIPFFVPQIMFWLLGLGSLGLEQVAMTIKTAASMPYAPTLPGLSTIISFLGQLAGDALPGKELFLFFYVLIAGIGFVSMLSAAAIFIFRGIPCFGKWKTVIFLCCLTGYLTIFLNFIPFVLIYAFAVVYLQGRDE